MNNHNHANSNAMAVSATLHCLTGCAIGEILGLIVGTIFNLNNGVSIVLAIALAFAFGLGLSAMALMRVGMGLAAALAVVVAADTLSITTMEIVDNTVVAIIPGALHATLIDPLFWVSMAIAMTAAFFAALPVNKYLLSRNKGHALTMHATSGHHNHNH